MKQSQPFGCFIHNEWGKCKKEQIKRSPGSFACKLCNR